MTPEEARNLLERSRELRFTFPTSFGDPGLEGEGLDRAELLEAMAELDEDEADELAARAWRLWMLPPRDPEGGLRFLRRAKGSLALYGAGLLALRTGDVGGSQQLKEQALAQAQTDEEHALAHLGLSRVALEHGDAAAALEHAVAARKAAGRAGPAFAQAPLHMHAQALRLQGDLDATARLFEESLALNREIGDEGMVDVELHNLGLVHVRRGDVEAAERYLSGLDGDPLAAAALAYARGDKHGAIAWLHQAEGDVTSDDLADLEWLRARL